MKCQDLFSEKNKKNISMYHLLKILPRVLREKVTGYKQVVFFKHFYKGDNFCDFFVFVIQPFLKWVYSKRKEFAPKMEQILPF